MTPMPLQDVRKIAVFRPNALGDFMFCLPALHALKHRYPAAEIHFLGLHWHRDFLGAVAGLVDQVVVVPAMAGIAGVPASASGEALPAFLERMRANDYDLALQMYGGGRHSNPVVRALGAKLSIGMRARDAPPLDRNLAYAGLVNRRLQLLELTSLAGARHWPMRRALQLTAAAGRLADELIPYDAGQRLVVIQPGATDPRRRWPVARFAAVADALADEGARIAINAAQAEWQLADQLQKRMRHPAINLAGRAGLPALCGLLQRGALIVSNDTGPLHLALALGTPAVGIYWYTNFLESAPLRQEGHRSALSLRIECPVCGLENLVERCEHDVSFVQDVSLAEVAAQAIDLFRCG